MLEDMAILTGGTVVSADTGMKLENLTIEDLGMIKRLEQVCPRAARPVQPCSRFRRR